MIRAPLTPAWFQANNFHQSEDGGWECLFGPEHWLRWKDGNAHLGTRIDIDPTINGPPPDKLIAENVNRVEPGARHLGEQGLGYSGREYRLPVSQAREDPRSLFPTETANRGGDEERRVERVSATVTTQQWIVKGSSRSSPQIHIRVTSRIVQESLASCISTKRGETDSKGSLIPENLICADTSRGSRSSSTSAPRHVAAGRSF